MLARLAIPAMVGIGILVALQAQVNGQLAAALGTGVRAGAVTALISFGGGLVLLTVLVIVSARIRAGLSSIAAAVRVGRLRWWQCIGGAGGAFVVASQGLTVATLGVALFTVAVVAGQSSSSLLVDQLGVGPAGRQAVTTTRLLGAVLTVVAVVLSVAERLGGSEALGAAAFSLVVLPLLGGFGAAFQQAVNGRVTAVGGPWAATWNNFVVGTALLFGFALVALAVIPGRLDSPPGTWWLYTGGPIGIVFISAAAMLVRTHGVLILGLCTVAGQVIGALVIDVVTGEAVGALSGLGAVLTLVGVAVASTPRRRRD